MAQISRVILSAFGDEGSLHKTACDQYAILAALGLQYYSLRFIDAGNGIKNVMKLTNSEIVKLRHLEGEYGLRVASIGSPIGKVKLRDVEDGTANRFVQFKEYLNSDVAKACELAHAFETKLVRGFSFYHPKGSDPWEHLPQAAEQITEIAELCQRNDLTFGIEVEANLVGQTGQLMAELYRRISHPAVVTIFDCGNLICQGFSRAEALEQYQAMKPSIGWMHVKDYHDPHQFQRTAHVEEDLLKNFVPADIGDGGHDQIMDDFRTEIPRIEERMNLRGIPGVFLDLEPHLKGGGQFGGFSGPDGLAVALKALTKILDHAKIGYHLRDFDDVRIARGF